MSDPKKGDSDGVSFAAFSLFLGIFLGIAGGFPLGVVVNSMDARARAAFDLQNALIEDGQAYWSIDPKTGVKSLRYTHPAEEVSE